MKRLIPLLFMVASALAQQAAPIRPPAVPLITHDPYFSVWSNADRLTDEPTKHWTGTDQPLTGLLRIDGAPYRFIGPAPRGAGEVPALEQVSLQITPTRTMYGFRGAGIQLDLTFLTPALPHDLDTLSRPVTYLTWVVRSTDAKPHNVAVYLDWSALWVVNTPEQRVQWSHNKVGDLAVMRMGSLEQPVLAKSGDNLRIDWGFLYIAVPPNQGVAGMRGTNMQARRTFTTSGELPESDDLEPPAQTSRNLPVLALRMDLGAVTAPVSRRVIVAYDDQFSIEYFNRRLRPYWRRNGMEAAELLTSASANYDAYAAISKAFDESLTADLVKAGGPKYAALATVAYRQTLAAHKLVADLDGTPLYFSKENFSNGCIDTVDVTYPSAPFFLLLNPQLLKAQLRPILDYSSLPRWRFPFAPHDLGTYPLANGQVYGGGEKTEENQMPVEESGNMLILLAALAKTEGNADFSAHYWPVLERWAAYLKDKGLDPENQLSTDDFAGHLAHNTNLSLKAIDALGGFGLLAQMTGKTALASQYSATAKAMAAKWVQMAADGDHYRLAFDKPGTWSQKYNLVWDKLLGLHIFPAEVARKEIAYYKTKQNAFGLPLDNRETYTKLDWIIWTATLTENAADFAVIADYGYKFANETSTRVPLSDWYWTLDGKQRGFQARSVVGGIFIKMLDNPETWKKWSSRAPKSR
jgi:hypothetical protein